MCPILCILAGVWFCLNLKGLSCCGFLSSFSSGGTFNLVAMALANAFVVASPGAVVSHPAVAHSTGRPSASVGTAPTAVVGAAVAAVAAGRRRQRQCHVKRKVTVVSEAGTQAGERPQEGKPLKVIVAGGGVGGLTCAFAMLKKGWDARVFETWLKLMSGWMGFA